MKTINFLAIIAFLMAFSCRAQVNPSAIKVDFGIYESTITSKPELFDLATMTKVIGLADIRKTKADGQEVILYFNMDGAKKWREITKNNIGKPIAFVVDGKIIYTPIIAAELRNGLAKVMGIKDEEGAKSLSESLNTSIPR